MNQNDIYRKILSSMGDRRPMAPKQQQAPVEYRERDTVTLPTFDRDVPSEVMNQEMFETLYKYIQISTQEEVEISVGTFKGNDSFIPGVLSAQAFNDALKLLDNIELGEKTVTDTKVEIQNRVHVRRVTNADGTVLYEKKLRRRTDNVDDKFWGYRLSKSREEIIGNYDDKHFTPDTIRHRHRTTYRFPAGSPFFGVVFDLTAVKEERTKQVVAAKAFDRDYDDDGDEGRGNYVDDGGDEHYYAPDDLDDPKPEPSKPKPEPEQPQEAKWYTVNKYEIEIERDNAVYGSRDRLATQDLANRMAGALFGIYASINRQMIAANMMFLDEHRATVAAHNALFAKEIKRSKIHFANPFRLYKNYWNKPTNIKIDDLLHEKADYSVTVKLDGVRYFLFFTTFGTYFCGPPDDVWRVGEAIDGMSGTLLDGEFYNDTYYIFDILFNKGRDVRSENFDRRYSMLSAYGVTSSVTDKRFKAEVHDHQTKVTKRDYLVLIFHKKSIKKARELGGHEVERTDKKEARAAFIFDEKSVFDDQFDLDEPEAEIRDHKTKTTKSDFLLYVYDRKAAKKAEELGGEEFDNEVAGVHKIYRFDDASQLSTYFNFAEAPNGTPKRPRGPIDLYEGYSVEVKEFFFRGSIYDRVRSAFDVIDSSTLKVDGLIFQSQNHYRNYQTRKWKPPSALTIDFLLRVKPESKHEYFLLAGTREGDVPFNDMTIKVKGGRFDGRNVDGRIVECSWNYEAETFEIERFRTDRDRPNALNVAVDVWRDIECPIDRPTIEGDTLKVMRRYHNMGKKRILHEEFRRSDIIVDIGSGRGGDLAKWETLGLSQVFVVEPNKENFEILEARRALLKENKVVVRPVTNTKGKLVGIEKTKNVMETVSSAKVDGVTAFFSLTFVAENEETFTATIDSIDQLLANGGVFLGAVMDGERVKDALMKVKTKKHSPARISNPSFSIEQVSKEFEGKFGDKITISINDPDSMVKNQHEWLFYFDRFENELVKRGIKLVETGFFDENDRRGAALFTLLPEDSKVFSAFNRYFIFKRTERLNRATRTNLDADSDEKVALPNPFKEPLYYLGIPLDESNVVDAVLKLVNEKYIDATPKKRKSIMLKTRERLAELSVETFENLDAYREIVKRMTKYEKSNIKEAAYEDFKKWLTDPERYLGMRTALELLGEEFKCNIVLLNPDGKPQVPQPISASKQKYETTIFLLSIDGTHMYPVVRVIDDKVQRIFTSVFKNGELELRPSKDEVKSKKSKKSDEEQDSEKEKTKKSKKSKKGDEEKTKKEKTKKGDKEKKSKKEKSKKNH